MGLRSGSQSGSSANTGETYKNAKVAVVDNVRTFSKQIACLPCGRQLATRR